MVITLKKSYFRIFLLMLLCLGHGTWILDTGRDYMNDVATQGRQFFPSLFPYAVIAFILSFLFGRNQPERILSIVLIALVVVAISQASGIRTNGDQTHFWYDFERCIHPKTSIGAWVVLGFLPVITYQGVCHGFRVHNVWFFVAGTGLVLYLLFCTFYVTSRIHPDFVYSSRNDALLVIALGTPVFTGIACCLLKLYDVSPFAQRKETRIGNAPGDFYVETGECITCGAPEHEAPDLIRMEEDGCYFFKQPQTPEELERAVMAVCVSCCGAVRYGGEDSAILDRLEQLKRESHCNVAKKPWWKFW